MESLARYAQRYALDGILSADLLSSLRPVRKGPGGFFITAGDPVSSLLFLVKGRVKIYSTLENGHRILAAVSRPFDVLGEVELFITDRYTLTVEALTDSLCLSLPIAKLRKSAERNCRLFIYLCARMGAKLRDRIIAESINLRYPVANRLASYLQASMDSEGWILGAVHLGEIADFLGSSYRQLSRVVRDFRRRGILDATRGRIRVRDKARLALLAREPYVRSTGRIDLPLIGPRG